MSRTSSNNLLVHQPDLGTGSHVAFTTVETGNMSTTVLAAGQTVQDTHHNRRAVEEQLGIHPGTTRFVSQIHSTTIVDAGPYGWAQQDALAEADAIVSVDGQQPLAILVADCLPVAFVTDYGPTAIAHAGRVGLLGGILENTVERLRQLDPTGQGNVTAIIGPSICGQCYEVPIAMRDEAGKQHPSIASETSWGTPALDLPAAAEHLLERLDVTVRSSGACTYTNELFYSHRRQPGVGRIAGVVWKDPETQ